MEVLIVLSVIVLCFVLLAVLGMDRYSSQKFIGECMNQLERMIKFMENRRVLEQTEVKKFVSNLMHFYEKENRRDREYSVEAIKDNNKLFFDEISRVYSDFADRLQFPAVKFPPGFNRKGISDTELSKEALDNIEKETEKETEELDKRTPEQISKATLAGLPPEMRRSGVFDNLDKNIKAALKKNNGDLNEGTE